MKNYARPLRYLALSAAVWLLLAAGLKASAAPSNVPNKTPASANGDGIAGLVVGAIWEDIGDVIFAGSVNVLYGSFSGLTADGNQFWHQGVEGVIGDLEERDLLSGALATGDFDGNGYPDLAAGTYTEDINGIPNTGAVNVLYASAQGLSVHNNQFWHFDVAGMIGDLQEDDYFSYALASGDFNADGYADLAIGAPFKSVGEGNDYVLQAGVVSVIYGSIDGLSTGGNQLWHQDIAGILGGAEIEDGFGKALASGDFNGDGYDDLAVGAPDEDIDDVVAAGAVNVIYGSVNGLSAYGNQIWHQDIAGILGVAELGDNFGRSLAAGDFNNDGFFDLAIGAPTEYIADVVYAGAVNVIYGSVNGLSAYGNQSWHQDMPGIADEASPNEFLGRSLATGDINNDGYSDLAIGVDGEDVAGVASAGALHILFGSQDGLTAVDSQFWHQDSPGILDAPHNWDQFGYALAACDFNGDGYVDVAAGVPGEGDKSGAVSILFGSAGGLSEAGNQLWDQDSPGILDQVEANDHFGTALACLPGTMYRTYLPLIKQ